MAVQIGWKVDINACVGCRACEVACKAEFDLKAGQGRRRRVVEKTSDESGTIRTFFTSLACNQCEKPACLAACPVSRPVGVGTAADSALWKDMDGSQSGGVVGVVRVEPKHCVGCRRCEWACPYGAPQFDPSVGKIHKCEMCWERMSNQNFHYSRRKGACVATCIGQSIKQDWVDTLPTVKYDFTSDDRDLLLDQDADGLAGNEPGADNDAHTGAGHAASVYHRVWTYPFSATNGPRFVSPGAGNVEFGFTRGSIYIADASLTKPALKVRNRVYVNRDGSGVV